MKISIITVTYNSQRYLHDCISSVLKQTYNDIEYLIIDGNSSDDTVKIIESFKDIKYISEPDNGIYDAINKGIKLATGDVVGILNSDDFFADEEVISRVAKQFNSDKSLDAIYSDVLFVQSGDISKSIRYYSSKRFRSFMFRFGFQPAHPTFYAKRETFRKNGLYRTDLKIAGDFELMMRFIIKGKIKYSYINDLWVKMRVGGASTSGLKSVLRLNNEIIKACSVNGLYTNKILVYSKYLVKWWSFVVK